MLSLNERISTALPAAQRTALSVSGLLSRLEDSSLEDSQRAQTEREVSLQINELSRAIHNLYTLAEKESRNRRVQFISKVRALEAKSTSLRQDMERYMSRTNRRRREADARRELLGARAEGRTAFSYQNERDSLERSTKRVEELCEIGTSSLLSLQEQRSRMKGAHRKALDVLNLLGLSRTVTRLVERRQHADKWIVYGGMLITSAIVFAIIYFFMM